MDKDINTRARGARLEPGSTAPEFTLSTPHGVEVSLSSCLLQGGVLVEFIRGTWDPDARRRIEGLAAVRESFTAKAARILVVTCERPATAALFLNERPTPLTLLVDESRSVAKGYGVHQRFAVPRWNIARPASFVIDRCGFVRYRFVAALSIHAAPVEAILAVLEGA